MNFLVPYKLYWQSRAHHGMKMASLLGTPWRIVNIHFCDPYKASYTKHQYNELSQVPIATYFIQLKYSCISKCLHLCTMFTPL